MLKNKVFLCLMAVLLFTDLSVKANDENKLNELIVVKKQRVNSERLEKILLKRNIYFKNAINIEEPNLSFSILKTGSEENIDTVANDLKKTGLFELVEPNYKLKTDFYSLSKPIKKLITSDNNFKSQYYLDQIKVPNAWLFSRGAPNAPIAVLDSGVDYSNSDLVERLLPCTTFVENTNSCQDDFGHGTQVASIIGSQVDAQLSLAGVSWLNPILPIKVSDSMGVATVETLVKGLDYAIKSGAKIAVISLSTEENSEALRIAVESAAQKGILIIASGGNTGLNEVRYPAGYDEVIGVGAVDKEQNKSYFSNMGPHIKIVAPGENIIVPSLDHNYLEEVSGTSFSTPQVAGIAALVWALRPSYTSEGIKKILLSSTKDLGDAGYDISFGYGEVDAEVAVKRALLKYEK